MLIIVVVGFVAVSGTIDGFVIDESVIVSNSTVLTFIV